MRDAQTATRARGRHARHCRRCPAARGRPVRYSAGYRACANAREGGTRATAIAASPHVHGAHNLAGETHSQARGSTRGKQGGRRARRYGLARTGRRYGFARTGQIRSIAAGTAQIPHAVVKGTEGRNRRRAAGRTNRRDVSYRVGRHRHGRS
eukprot:6213295-Pleurochrysis_carterae.AAC.2